MVPQKINWVHLSWRKLMLLISNLLEKEKKLNLNVGYAQIRHHVPMS